MVFVPALVCGVVFEPFEGEISGLFEGDFDIDTCVAHGCFEEGGVFGVGVDVLVEVLSVDVKSEGEINIGHDGEEDGVEPGTVECVYGGGGGLEGGYVCVEVFYCVFCVGVFLAACHLDFTVFGDLEVDELAANVHNDCKAVSKVACTAALGALEDGSPHVLEILEGDDGAVLDVLVGILNDDLLSPSALLGLDDIVGHRKVLVKILDIAGHIGRNNNGLGRDLNIVEIHSMN